MTDERFAFEPVYDLRTARLAGFEIVPRRPEDAIAVRVRGSGWSARQVAEVDAGTAVSAVASARRADPGAPVQVAVAADTVVLARHRLRAMLDATGSVAPLLMVAPALAAAPDGELVEGLAELRRWGFRIALDGIGRSFGLELLVTARPEVVALEPRLAVADPDTATAGVVRAVCGVAAANGVRVAAAGVADADALTALHASGVSLARGPLLGRPGHRPTVEGETPPALLPLLSRTGPHRAPTPPTGTTEPRERPSAPSGPVPQVGPAPAPVRTLAAAAVTLPDDAVADTVRTALARCPDAGGVVLVDQRRRPTGYLERSRFLLAMAGPFGHALWAAKPASSMADPPRTADERMSLTQAMELSLSGDRSRGYDELVLVGPGGACTGVVPVSELWRRSMRRPDEAPGPARAAVVRPAPPVPGVSRSGAHRPSPGPRPTMGSSRPAPGPRPVATSGEPPPPPAPAPGPRPTAGPQPTATQHPTTTQHPAPPAGAPRPGAAGPRPSPRPAVAPAPGREARSA